MRLSTPIKENKTLTMRLDTDGYYVFVAAGPDAGITAEAGPTSLCYTFALHSPGTTRYRIRGPAGEPQPSH